MDCLLAVGAPQDSTCSSNGCSSSSHLLGTNNIDEQETEGRPLFAGSSSTPTITTMATTTTTTTTTTPLRLQTKPSKVIASPTTSLEDLFAAASPPRVDESSSGPSITVGDCNKNARRAFQSKSLSSSSPLQFSSKEFSSKVLLFQRRVTLMGGLKASLRKSSTVAPTMTEMRQHSMVDVTNKLSDPLQPLPPTNPPPPPSVSRLCTSSIRKISSSPEATTTRNTSTILKTTTTPTTYTSTTATATATVGAAASKPLLKSSLRPSSLQSGGTACGINSIIKQQRRVRGLWNESSSCCFSQLHDDLLLFILSHLSMLDLCKSSMVCKRWQHVSGLDQAWTQVDATEFVHETFRRFSSSQNFEPVKAPELTSQALESQLQRHKPETLTIKSIEHQLMSSFFLPSVNGLQELTLSGFADLNDTHVHVMLLSHAIVKTKNATPFSSSSSSSSSLSKGKFNTAHRCRFSSKGNLLLRKLSLDYCPLLTNASVRSIANTCPNLELLSLRGNRNIDSLLPLQDMWKRGVPPISTNCATPSLEETLIATTSVSSKNTKKSPALPPSLQQLFLATPAFGVGSDAATTTAPPPPPAWISPPAPAGGLGALFDPPTATSTNRGLSSLFPSPGTSSPSCRRAPLSTKAKMPVQRTSSSSSSQGQREGLGGDDGGKLTSIDLSGSRVSPTALLESFRRREQYTSLLSLDASNTVVQLKSLIMSGSGELWSNETLKELSRCLDVSQLQAFDIGCSNRYVGATALTPSSLENLLLPFPSLSQLSSSSASHLLPSRPFLQLQRLCLAGHRELTAALVANICQVSPRLRELVLEGCVGIHKSPQADIQALGTALAESTRTSLVQLSLAHCFSKNERQLVLSSAAAGTLDLDSLQLEEEIQGRSLLVGLCSSPSSGGLLLKGLDLSGWYFLTEQDEKMLREALPSLPNLVLANTRCTQAHHSPHQAETSAGKIAFSSEHA